MAQADDEDMDQSGKRWNDHICTTYLYSKSKICWCLEYGVDKEEEKVSTLY